MIINERIDFVFNTFFHNVSHTKCSLMHLGSILHPVLCLKSDVQKTTNLPKLKNTFSDNKARKRNAKLTS